jgi:plastocyanin
MQKVIATLSLLALVGAGCVSETKTETKATATTPQPEIEFTTDASTGTLKQTNTGETDEDGVPIIDVVLGEEKKTDVKTETDVSVVLDVSVEAGNFFFKPNIVEAKAGQKVNVTFSKNAGFHTFVIDEIKTKATINEKGTITFTAPTKPGSYKFYCDIGSHRANGMEGTLIVK